MTNRRWLTVSVLSALLCGCITNRITNVTPAQAYRTPDDLYRIEARWDSNQRSVKEESLAPKVVVGHQMYPMRRTPDTPNRWEALVPVPAEQRFLNYRFKFDYLYQGMPEAKRDSKVSGSHQLEIIQQ